MKVDCDLIMDGDTKPAGGREGRGTVGVWSVGVGKYSQDEIGVLWDGAWEAPVHALINSLFLFFRVVLWVCSEGKRLCSEALLTARHMRSHCRVVRKGLL
jgi:hypothetical protein